jgi:phosphoglycolate phosphatase
MHDASCVLFDLDGTLIDSAPSILRSLDDALQRHGMQPVVPLHPRLIGPPLLQTLRLISGHSQPELLTSLAEAFKASYDAQGHRESIVYDGIGQLLSDLHQAGRRLFVVTNKRILPTRRIIEWLGWNAHFEGVHAADAYTPPLAGKCQVLEAVIHAHRLPVAQCVYLGDRDEDRSAAHAAGMSFIAVSWGYGEWAPHPQAAIAELKIVQHPTELLPLLLPDGNPPVFHCCEK